MISTGSLATAFIVVPQLSDATQAMRDYSITASPSSVTMNQGSTAYATVTVTSISSFNAATGLMAIVTPSVGGLMAALSLGVITPLPDSRAESTLTITAVQNTAVGTYQVTVSSSGGTKSHTASISVTVAPADFTITTPPYTLNVPQGAYNSTILTVASVSGFAGNVSLSSTVPLGYLVVGGNVSSVHLVSGGSAHALVDVLAGPEASLGTYTFTVTGTFGATIHSLSITVEVIAASSCGCCFCGTEALSLETYTFNSGTNVTLSLMNAGSAIVTLSSYYVRDTSGNTYYIPAWNGPTITPSSMASTIILIEGSCPSCALTGTPFTFTSGNAYTITVVTSRNNQFVFTVVR